MVALEWEIRSVWPYVNSYIRPALESIGVPFAAIPRAEFATKDFWGGQDGTSCLLPVYSNQSGAPSKLPEFCSGEWKREVVARWAARQPGWKERGVSVWTGISLDEKDRRRAPRRLWIQPAYPLLDVVRLGVAACLQAVAEVGWPEPPRSRCRHCPNQSDTEWSELTAQEWEAVCALDEHIRTIDPHAYLHKQMIPLRLVTLRPNEKDSLFRGGCSAGTCY